MRPDNCCQTDSKYETPPSEFSLQHIIVLVDNKALTKKSGAENALDTAHISSKQHHATGKQKGKVSNLHYYQI